MADYDYIFKNEAGGMESEGNALWYDCCSYGASERCVGIVAENVCCFKGCACGGITGGICVQISRVDSFGEQEG